MSALSEAPLVLTVEEAARVLRIGRSAAYAAVKSGDLPVIRVGRTVRVPRHLLEAMLGLHHDAQPAKSFPKEETPTLAGVPKLAAPRASHEHEVTDEHCTASINRG